MMTKTNSSKNGKFRFLFIIPAIAIALTLNLQCTSESETPMEEKLITIDISDQTTVKADIVNEEQIFAKCEVMPEFPGGVEALQTWIAENVKYPAEAQKKNIEGRVYVGFVVNKEGNVEVVKLMRGASPSLDTEAIRVVSEMPKWKPGKQRGETVSVAYTVPINFALK